MQKVREIFPHFISSWLNSYSQIFFSNNKIFAVLLVIVSFFDLFAGASGMIAVMLSNIAAYLIGFNRTNINAGYYGFNSLLVGLGLGVYYQPGLEFFIVLSFASLLTLFLTVMLEGVIGKYGLPFLSISFLIAYWMVTLASRQFQHLQISERGIYSLNEMYALGGLSLVKIYNWFNNLGWHESIIIYFRSLGAIFFQYHLFAGLIIAFGLLIYSRIAFLLSLIGFFSAYTFYYFIGANINELSYSYIGFNFILTAIAIGGFFIISSRYSFLWVILLTPLISFTITSVGVVLDMFQLSVYSLPFNFIVILFLYVLKFRERFVLKPAIVGYQYFSPEKNLYAQHNYKSRFEKAWIFPFVLPIWGEWNITQGHEGEYTHKNDWRHAWDFEIEDEHHYVFSNTGRLREDYYCYNKPVIAPASGWVETTIDYIDDNQIGDINLENNWGNTVIIRHADYLYSKICHLKKDSVKVKKGDWINKGDLIGFCGNSGRSPQPHIHFQIQSTPYIGSKTIDYPISNYILHRNDEYILKSYETPQKGDIISNIEKNSTLAKAYQFIPGQNIVFEVIDHKGKTKLITWEVWIDLSNNTYLYCAETNSKAYYVNDGIMHYFTSFQGDRSSLLFYFYLANYKIILGFYKNIEVSDSYPLHVVNKHPLMFLQDFLAPFHLFMKAHFNVKYLQKSESFFESTLQFESYFKLCIYKRCLKKLTFNLTISKDSFSEFVIHNGKKLITAKEIIENER
jgi:urea transporter/murein DD-endopeptidase MepM/ murein hydrolase activator NlpD